MTKLELAKEYLFELYNDADHVAKLVGNARYAMGADGGEADPERALLELEPAVGPIERLEMRLRDAKRALQAAQAEVKGA